MAKEYKEKYISYRYNYEEDTIPDFVAYTDGSCNNLSPYGEGGSAYIIISNEQMIKKSAKGFLKTTNNRMELLAIISAITSIPTGASIEIFTDSQYCIMTAQGKKVKKNLDLVSLFHQAERDRKIKLTWVKGHDENYYNELCDAMADEQTKLIREKYNLPLFGLSNSPKINNNFKERTTLFCAR